MAIPGEPSRNFSEILANLWWKLDKALDEDGVRYSALTLLLDAVKYGTTTIIDHHASPNFIDGSLDVVYEAVLQSGLRCALCYEVTDRDGEERALAGIRENARFIERVQAGEVDPMVKAHFGLHASLTVSMRRWIVVLKPIKIGLVSIRMWLKALLTRKTLWQNTAKESWNVSGIRAFSTTKAFWRMVFT